MTIEELKYEIENNLLNDDLFLILELTDSTSLFIVNQYIDKICKDKSLNKRCIESFLDIPDESFIKDDNLYIITTNKWTMTERRNNCVVICDSSNNNEKIIIPKLADWEVVDYVAPMLRGVKKEKISNLINKYSKNYFRFKNDIDKVSIFDVEYQDLMFDNLFNDFKDVSNLTIWDLSNGIIKRNKNEVINVLSVINNIDIEPIGLITVLYKNFSNILRIQTDSTCNAKKLGISDKQFYVIRNYNCGYYSKEELIHIMKLLTNAEYLFKYCELDINTIIDYLICKIL